jgi:hypothetical protein
MSRETAEIQGLWNLNKSTSQPLPLAVVPSLPDPVGGGDGAAIPTSGAVSAFANYPKWSLVRRFWRLYLTGIAVSLGGMYAGYCLSAVGNIIANQGACDQYALRCV